MGKAKSEGQTFTAQVSGTTLRPEEFIPAAAVDTLPLQAEAFTQWPEVPDVLTYLRRLYSEPSRVLMEDGTESLRWIDYGQTIFDDLVNRVPEIMESFGDQDVEARSRWERQKRRHERATQVGGDVVEVANYEPFIPPENALLGLALKAHIAWSGTVQRVLEESMFFSIAHVMETERELDASLLLASRGYYKQAHQLLRSILEEMIMPIHFIGYPQAFAEWKAGNYRTPPLRGKRGILKGLTDQGVLPAGIASHTSQLYGAINESVHGAESRLALAGVFTGDNIPGFPWKTFDEWARDFAGTVFVGIELMRRIIVLWKGAERSTLICDICHNTEEFDEKPTEFGGRKFVSYRCRVCGSTVTRTAPA